MKRPKGNVEATKLMFNLFSHSLSPHQLELKLHLLVHCSHSLNHDPSQLGIQVLSA